MKKRRAARSQHIRERIAAEAARAMLESGIRDFQLAKRKAAERLRVEEPYPMPGNDEIERAMLEYQRLFHADTQPQHLQRLREVALQAMRLLQDFQPSLVGPVLHGTADQHTDVTLHVFAEPAEEVALFLLDRGIPHENTERRLRVDGSTHARFPALRFVAGETLIEVLVLPERERRHAPLSPVDGRPMQRAGIAKLEELLAVDA